MASKDEGRGCRIPESMWRDIQIQKEKRYVPWMTAGTQSTKVCTQNSQPLPYAYAWLLGQIHSDSSLNKWNQFCRKNEGGSVYVMPQSNDLHILVFRGPSA